MKLEEGIEKCQSEQRRGEEMGWDGINGQIIMQIGMENTRIGSTED